MPTSVHGNSDEAGRLAQGFTLIEMLLVVLIVGIGTSLIVPGLSATRVSAKDEAARIATLIDHAQTLASVRGVALGWQADADGYGFLDWRGKWKQLELDSVLRRRELPPGITLDLASPLVKSQGQAVPQSSASSSTAFQPQLIFPPIGFMRPFSLRVTSAEGSWNVVGDATGRISLAEDAAR